MTLQRYLDKWLPHLCHGDSWVAPHYPSCTVPHWVQALHSWCIEELVHSPLQSRNYRQKLPLQTQQIPAVNVCLYEGTHTNYSISCSYCSPTIQNTLKLPDIFMPSRLHTTSVSSLPNTLCMPHTCSPPEPLHTDLHSALTLPLSTKLKISRATLWLWGSDSLTDNIGYSTSEMSY